MHSFEIEKFDTVQGGESSAVLAQGAIEVPEEDQTLLAEIGMEAVTQDLIDDARKIFDALALIRPEHAAATVGYAYIAFMEDAYDHAIELLTDPEFEEKDGWFESQGLLLLCYWFGERRAEATKLRKKLLEGPDGPGKSVAMNLADNVH